jgi:FAD dependent oxidoreductase
MSKRSKKDQGKRSMKKDTVREGGRETDVFGSFDVVIVGGGPAGLAAATAAARSAADVLLIERYGFLGGMGTAGGVTNFAGLFGLVHGNTRQVVHGVVDELLDRLDRLGGLNSPQHGLQGRITVRSYDVSALKCAADDMLISFGAKLLFHAAAVDVVMDGDTIAALIVETKSGRRAVRARTFIDCSGDADLAARARVPFETGDGHGGGLFPTMMFRVGGVDAERAIAAIGDIKAIDRLMSEASGNGYRFPREGAIVRPQKNTSEWRVNVTQIRNSEGRAMDATDALQLSAGEIEGRRQVLEYFRFLKNEVPGFENAHVVEIAPQVGIRESRRIRGQYSLSGDDIIGCADFDDTIGVNAWPMELHVAGKIEWGFFPDGSRGFCQLPYRILVPIGVSNLLVAGRCASMSHEGQSAARASGACFVMGEAAGTAAAIIAGGTAHSPEQVDVAALQQKLASHGVYLGADL